ncbi:aldehyde dehydrogenase family protein [Paraburkholderia dipogonis]|uniref:aldehyde dehydrogenase family protein n=1 Tax=Paraburkholderia dipogonis TaxID=1211383 RepID=UPI0035ED2AC3
MAREATSVRLRRSSGSRRRTRLSRLPTTRSMALASYLYSRDLGRVFRVSEALEYGMAGVNTGLISNEMAPFGGGKAIWPGP